MQEVSLYISVFCVCGGKGRGSLPSWILKLFLFSLIYFSFYFSFLMIFLPPPLIGTEDAPFPLFVMLCVCVCVYVCVYCRINNRRSEHMCNAALIELRFIIAIIPDNT